MTVEEPLPPDTPNVAARLAPARADEVRRERRADERELAGPELAGATLHDLRLRGCRLHGLDLTGARAAGLDLADVVARDGSWANLDAREGSIARLEATGLRGTGVQLPAAELADCTFVDCRLDLASFRHARLERVVFRDCRLDEADFLGATLRSVRLEGCVLARASLAEATFDRCEIRACELTDLVGAERLRGTRLPWPDVVQIAGLLATAAGIEIVD